MLQQFMNGVDAGVDQLKAVDEGLNWSALQLLGTQTTKVDSLALPQLARPMLQLARQS